MLAVLPLLSLPACSTAITATEVVDGTVVQICRSWEPIRPSRKDVLTQGTAEQIATNNAANEQWCRRTTGFASVTSRT